MRSITSIKSGITAIIIAGTALLWIPVFSAENPGFSAREITTPLKISSDHTNISTETIESLFPAGETCSWKFISVETDKKGFRHTRYQQCLHGFAIENAVIILHESSESGLSATGHYLNIKNVPVASIDKASVLQTLTNKSTLTGSKIVSSLHDDNFNWIAQANSLKLVCTIDYFPANSLQIHKLTVDATTLEVISDSEHSCNANSQGTAVTEYNGVKNLGCFFDSGVYSLKNTLKGNGIFTRNLNFQLNYQHITEFTDSDNFWEQSTLPVDQYATDAHFCAGKYYDFLDVKFGRNSLDNNGFQLVSYLNYGTSFSNAFWNGQAVVYGSGTTTTNPLTTIDIAGHEFTHGLIQKTANLSYSNEPGTINEAISDIFGVALEFYSNPQQANWTIAEQSGTTLRSLSDPGMYNQPSSYHGANWYYGSGDQGGVHYNSGFINKWFYLVAHGETGINEFGSSYSISGIGVQNATEILYHALISYLLPASGFDDLRTYTLQSTIDLYGNCSPEYQSVLKAWDAVAFGNSNSNPQIETTGSNQFCNGDSLLIQVTNIPGTIYTWYLNGNVVATGVESQKFVSNTGLWKVATQRCNENYISNEIALNHFPSTPVSTSGGSTCQGDAITLAASPMGGVFSVPNPYSGPSTNYTYRYTDGNGCEYTATGNVVVHEANQVHIMNQDASYPENSAPVQLTADMPCTFYGTGVTGNYFFPDAAGANSTPVVYAIFTATNGCSSKDSILLEIIAPCIKENATISIQPSSETVASGDPISFDVNASSTDFSFQWILPEFCHASGSLNENHLEAIWGDQDGTVELIMINTCRDTIRKEYRVMPTAKIAVSHLRMFPNPATNFVNVSLAGTNADSGFQLNITDRSGRLVLSMTSTTPDILVPISTINPGIYVVEIISNKKFFREKLVVE